MVSLCVLLLALVMKYLARHGPPEGTVLGLVLAAAAAITLADQQGRWLTDGWSGVLIGLSLAAYLWSAWLPAALLGVSALFVRELSAPYCVACMALAIRARRRQEVIVWMGGLAIFALYYGAHALQVADQIRADDLAHRRSWVQFGGLSFWLATIKTSKALFLAPRVVLAAVCVLLVSALWSRTLPTHVRWSVIAYSLFFAVAGQPFNDYWGFVSAFVYAVALAYGPDGLWTLVTGALPSRRARLRAA
jgi:hypothetical protein